MKEITGTFGALYEPVKALVVMQHAGNGYQNDYYVESYDVNTEGLFINGHPLSVAESNKLAKALQVSEKKERGFLNPKGFMPRQVITINSTTTGYAVWHTPPQAVRLLFTENLDIPSATAQIPALIWKAGKNSLQVFAVADADITENTALCHAPFFNVYQDGRVCMGNVRVAIPKDCNLEQFMELWQSYFFNSYFSHLFGGHQPVKGNIVQLWQKLTASQEPFPTEVLIPNKYTIKHLLK